MSPQWKTMTSASLNSFVLADLLLAGLFDCATGRARSAAAGGMVVSVSKPESHAGWDVLQDGGRTVDAAVATAFALAVTFPEAGNIGGGGFMPVHPAHARRGNGAAEPVAIDYRETAPAATTPDRFAGDEPSSSHPPVGVPGTVRGLALAHRKYDRLPRKRLVEPAVRLARDGFEVDADHAAALNEALAKAADHPEFRRVFAPPRAAGEAARPWRAGDRLVQPDLARTLLRIADEGEGAFYAGTVAAS
jgi:gamma-glutamyltranspeptidase/glutathione hydrolase